MLYVGKQTEVLVIASDSVTARVQEQHPHKSWYAIRPIYEPGETCDVSLSILIFPSEKHH